MIRHTEVKVFHLKPQTPKHVEIIKFDVNLHMIHHSKGLDFEITDSEYRHEQAYTGEDIPS